MNDNIAYNEWKRERDAWMRNESQKLIVGMAVLAGLTLAAVLYMGDFSNWLVGALS